MPTNENAQTTVQTRRCGFRDVYLAKVTANDASTYTAGKPFKLARAVSGKISDKYSTEKIYSDDGVEESVTTYEGTDVELELHALKPDEKSDVFGWLAQNGYLVAASDQIAPELALGFRSKRTNGKYEFTWLYAGKFGEGFESDYQTEADKKTMQTDTIKGGFYARQKDNRIRIQVDEGQLATADTDAAAAIKAWFDSVQELPTAGGS